MIYLAPLEQDIHLTSSGVETRKFFANKLWNAARLVKMRLGAVDPRTVRLQVRSLADRWILSRYAHCVKDVSRNLKTTG
jgi:valyl-tRNA synthetase